MDKDLGKTTVGIQANIAGLLCYLAGFVTGIVFFLIEKENKFVRFHAMQSMVAFGAIFVVQIFLGMMSFMAILLPLVSLFSLGLWIYCMVKAYQGEQFKLPLAGEVAEKKI